MRGRRYRSPLSPDARLILEDERLTAWLRGDYCRVEEPLRTGSQARVGQKTHGGRHTREYNIWRMMVRRCTNPREINYHHYGGRGIRVCDRWLDFAGFIADMGRAPTEGHTLDRIDPDGHYEPANCRWATADIQAQNKRRTPHTDAVMKVLRRLPYRYQGATLSDICRSTGAYTRHVERSKLQVEEALAELEHAGEVRRVVRRCPVGRRLSVRYHPVPEPIDAPF